jgi:hypothetical protein
MGYILPTEYIQYGLTAETTDDWITMASSLIESWCKRPSLLPTQYVERMRLTAGTQSVRPSYAMDRMPITLEAVRVRYGRPRRGEVADPFREQIAWAFSLPGSWSALDIARVDVNPSTSELIFPENFLGLNYNEVEATYTAGLAVIPAAVKIACAQIVKNAQAMPSTSVKSTRLDTLQMEYFGSSLVDVQVQALLRPYRAQRLG